MKKAFLLATAVLGFITINAQTTDEIISRMESEVEKHRNEGTIMTMDMKLLLIGEVSTTIYSLGDKYRANIDELQNVTWGDGTTTWTYDAEKNQITIDKATKSSESEANADMFSGITAGYDVKLKSETDQAWYFKCKKSKNNKNKDDPKSMDLVVDKKTYYPLSMTSKVTVATITLRNLSFGVTEEQVTFNPAAYPGATIIDKR